MTVIGPTGKTQSVKRPHHRQTQFRWRIQDRSPRTDLPASTLNRLGSGRSVCAKLSPVGRRAEYCALPVGEHLFVRWEATCSAQA